MKTNTLTLIIAAALFTHAGAVGPGSHVLLESRQARAKALEQDPSNKELAQALTNFDAAQTQKLGDGWLERLNSSTRTEAEELADLYVEGHPCIYWWGAEDRDGIAKKLLRHIAGKTTLNAFDLDVITKFCEPRRHFPELVARLDEILALVPVQHGREYYLTKYTRILGLGGAWDTHLTPDEWMAFSLTELSVENYQLMRDNLLGIAMDAMTRKREKSGKPVEGPAFEAAMAPVVAALDEPLFAGLQAALAELNITLTAPDYSAVVELADRHVSAIERRAINEGEARKSLGSLMFVKGVAAYNAWKNTLPNQP